MPVTSKPRISYGFIESLYEEDALELEYYVYEVIDEYLIDEMIRFSKPTFYEEMMYCLTEPIYELYLDACLCDEDDYDEIYEFVKQRVDVIITSILHIPIRSYTTSDVFFNPIQDISGMTQHINELIAIPQPEQKTDEWYKFRYGLMTASAIGKIFSTDAQRNSLIYEKCHPFDQNNNGQHLSNSVNSPLHWGNKYEYVSIMVYNHMYNTTVLEFGCIQHPKYPCIGASPDGINIDESSPRFGRMLEIKNIVNREITGIPMELYWIQMQIQMETCDLPECDFLETRFKEYENECDFYADAGRSYKGVILYFVKKYATCDSKPMYEYMPFSEPLSKSAVDNWISKVRYTHSGTYSLYMPIFWYLEEYSCVLVPRNKLWFNAALPKILDTWKIIENERINGYEHRAAKKRVENVVKRGVLCIKLDAEDI
jgi:putative phage-type endonuclease